MTKGNLLELRHIKNNQWVKGVITLVSENQESLAIELESGIQSGRGFSRQGLALLATKDYYELKFKRKAVK